MVTGVSKISKISTLYFNRFTGDLVAVSLALADLKLHQSCWDLNRRDCDIAVSAAKF